MPEAMLSVEEALAVVLSHAQPLPSQQVALTEAIGLTLAEAITSDIDSPPYDKAIVDGYAVVAASAQSPDNCLPIVEEVTAGNMPTQAVLPGVATRIMTGAPLPPGADAVVMIEKTHLVDDAQNGHVRILDVPVRSGQNIARCGTVMVRGQTVLEPGKRLRGIELGLLAEVGRATVRVVPRPRLSIVPTGDELVEVGEVPGAGQIRNSNGPLLYGQATQAGAEALVLDIARDDITSLRNQIAKALAADIVVLSGGVSAGVLDLVPQVLREMGVQPVFHKINLKPGKPLWFGIGSQDEHGRQSLVFGLPGNPVSSLVCFELFVRPAIEKMGGRDVTGLRRVDARLTREHRQRGERPTYWPALFSVSGGTIMPLPWKGSGDLRTLADANALAVFPPGDRTFTAGDTVTACLLPGT